MTEARFRVYAWGVLGYNLVVILWGAYVRATGSGAGCGSHWPLCNGEVIPRAPRVETLIEFTHRLSSGLSLILVLGLLVFAFRLYPKGHRVRLGAVFSSAFMLTEALLGAGLVLFELVAGNASAARAVSVSVHLGNTFLLLASLTLTANWASGAPPITPRGRGWVVGLLGIGLLGILVLGTSGAVTALGDTLFPVTTLAEGLRQDLSPTAHFFIRLRFLHPLIAVMVSIYLFSAVGFVRLRRPDVKNDFWAAALRVLIALQVGAGAINVVLLAPVWLQLVHLLLADLIWITGVLFCAMTWGSPLLRPEPASEGGSG